MKRYCLLWIAGLLWACCGWSQTFTLADVMSAPFTSGLVAAPYGDRLAWVQNSEGARNVWVAEGPDYQGRMITAFTGDDGQDLADLVFSPGGGQLFFVRGGGPNRQGEIPNPVSRPDPVAQVVWSVPFSGGEARMLADGSAPLPHPDGQSLAFIRRGQVWSLDLKPDGQPRQMFQIRGGAGNLNWSPDGSQLAFVSHRGDHSFIGIFDRQTRNIRYLSPSVDLDQSPVWSADGKRLAFIREPHEKGILLFIPKRSALPWSVMVAEVATGKTTAVWQAPEGPGSAFRNVSAARQLFWTGSHLVFPYEGDGWTHLWAVPDQGGTARNLTPGAFEIQFVSQASDGKSLVYSSNQGDIDRQHVWQVRPTDKAPSQLTSGPGIEWMPVTTAASGHVAALASGGRKPAHAVRVQNGQLRPLAPGSIPARFPADQLVEPEQIIFTAADGMKINGQLFRPAGLKPGEKRPAILFFHGGSQRQMLLGFHPMGYYHNSYALNQYLAARGYIVFSVNYRSGTGYGMEFREAINYGADGASEFNDVLGAGLYLKNRPDVDPDRIGLWGGSYGGYLTALGLAKASDLFAAGVDIHGVHDWNVVIRNFVPDYEVLKRPEIAKKAYESSPVAYIDTWRSPVLLIHGDDDRNVPFSETVDIAESLRKQKVYFEQLIFPDEIHGFLLHRNWLAAFEATADFFDRKLTGY